MGYGLTLTLTLARTLTFNIETGLIDDRKLVVDLLHLEQKHSLKLKNVKLATLYVKAGQTNIDEIFNNKVPPESRFFEFMDSIADRIEMDGWPHYRGEMGEMGPDNSTSAYFTNFVLFLLLVRITLSFRYYTKWEGVEMLFHIAPWMDSEQHRRLCGNDVGILHFP